MHVYVIEYLLRAQVHVPHSWRLEHQLRCLTNQELAYCKELLFRKRLIPVVYPARCVTKASDLEQF